MADMAGAADGGRISDEEAAEFITLIKEVDALEDKFHARVSLDGKVSSLLAHVSVMTALCGLFLQFTPGQDTRTFPGLALDLKQMLTAEILLYITITMICLFCLWPKAKFPTLFTQNAILAREKNMTDREREELNYRTFKSELFVNRNSKKKPLLKVYLLHLSLILTQINTVALFATIAAAKL